MLGIAALFIGACALSFFGVTWVTKWAEQRNWLAIPNLRSSHVHPTPLGGGLVIVSVTLLGFLLSVWLHPDWSWQVLLAYMLGALLVAGVSWWNDMRTLPVWLRLLVHGLAAGLAIWGIGAWQAISLPGFVQFKLAWLGVPITLVWIVGLTNAYNFMDGIDGIAGSQAIVAGLGWAALGSLIGQPLLSLLGLLIAASNLGFLGHNWPPAKVFMGDVGSAFLGYSFAVLPIIASQMDYRAALAGILLVWPFVFDSVFTILRRSLRGESILSAHRTHLYQRLIIVGQSHRNVTLIYIVLAISSAALAMAWMRGRGVLVAIGSVLLFLATWGFVLQQESTDLGRSLED
ncbi:MAG TPA: glycosyltransferase family 4 protein [Anaerolineae bacterium]|nr:glycosyltransferase family 4 protein [Anaerolineae bacterium]